MTAPDPFAAANRLLSTMIFAAGPTCGELPAALEAGAADDLREVFALGRQTGAIALLSLVAISISVAGDLHGQEPVQLARRICEVADLERGLEQTP